MIPLSSARFCPPTCYCGSSLGAFGNSSSDDTVACLMAVNICEFVEEPLLEDLLALGYLPDFRTRDYTGSGFFFNPEN